MSNLNPLMRLLFSQTYAAGLDIEDGLLRLAHVQPNKLAITAHYEHPLPPGLVVNGEILDERELARHLADALRASGIKNGYYVTHTPVAHTALRLLRFPPMPKKELKDAVRYEAARNLPYTLAEAAIGFVPLEDQITTKAAKKKGRKIRLKKGKGDESTEAPNERAQAEKEEEAPRVKKAQQPRDLLVAATPNAHVLTLMRVAKQAGIRLGVVEPRPIATLRALKHQQALQVNDLTLDINATHASITVITDGSLKLARNLPYTREQLEDDAGFDTAERLMRDITLTLEYLTRINDTLTLRRIVVTGGTLHPSIASALEDLGLTVHTVTPPDTIPPAGMPVYGLALRGAAGI